MMMDRHLTQSPVNDKQADLWFCSGSFKSSAESDVVNVEVQHSSPLSVETIAVGKTESWN